MGHPDRLVDDGEGEDFAGAGGSFGWGRVLRLEETELAIAQSVIEDDLVGGWADLGAGEIDLVADGAGGGLVYEAAGDGLELAVVADNVEANKLIVAGGASLGHVSDERNGSADDEAAAHASDKSVQVLLHQAGGGNMLDHSA